MPRILKDLVITEVSSVDRGAGEGVKVLLMKRNTSGEIDMTAEELQAAVKKAAEEAAATATAPLLKALSETQRELKVAKMSPAHKAHYDTLKTDELKKSFEDMKDEDKDEECKKVAKAAEQDPAITEISKSLAATQAENAELRKRLDAVDLEKAQADFAKRAANLGLTQAGDGELMRKAYAGDKEAQAGFEKRQAEVTAALKAQADTGALFQTFGKSGTTDAANGNAYSTLMAKAEELRKTETKLSKEQAFAKVYTDPANAQLKKQYESEEARGLAKVVA